MEKSHAWHKRKKTTDLTGRKKKTTKQVWLVNTPKQASAGCSCPASLGNGAALPESCCLLTHRVRIPPHRPRPLARSYLCISSWTRISEGGKAGITQQAAKLCNRRERGSEALLQPLVQNALLQFSPLNQLPSQGNALR